MNRGENSAEVAHGSGDDPPAGKRLRFDDPVTRPRLDVSGVQVEEYLRNYSDRLVEAQLFARLTHAVRPDDDVVQVRLTLDSFVKLPPLELLWKLRWTHVGNLVKLWDAPLDLPYFRSEEEFDFMTLTSSYLGYLLADEAATAIIAVTACFVMSIIDITTLFPPLAEM